MLSDRCHVSPVLSVLSGKSKTVYCVQMVGWNKMPLCHEIGLGHIVLDGDPAAPTERGTVRLCGFRRISTFGLGVSASPASFIAVFLQSFLCLSSLTVTVAFDVKRRSPTLFPVLLKPE